MSDVRVYTAQSTVSRAATDGKLVAARGLRDGALVAAPWELALVMEGKVFGASAGTVTTGIAGHATADADQPEVAIRLTTDAVVVLPLFLEAGTQSFETTLGIHGVFYAVSNIDVGNGTSTALTPQNMALYSANATTVTARHTYSGNGTDPLTAGNFTELGRAAGNFDSDAATSGILGLRLVLNAAKDALPLCASTGSIVGYGEGGTTANFFFNMRWAEFSSTEMS